MSRVRTRTTRPRSVAAIVALAALLTACTAGDDPRAALRAAAADLRTEDATELRVRVEDAEALRDGGIDADLVGLAAGGELVLRSSRERAVHARLEVDDEEGAAALDAVADRLTPVGLERIATLLTAGDWLRVTNPPEDGAPDPLGDGLGAALERLLEAAGSVEESGDGDADDPERTLRVTAPTAAIDRFIGDVVAATDPLPEAGTGASEPDAEDGTGPVDITLSDGRVTAVDLSATVGDALVPFQLVVAHPVGADELPTDAQPFGLRALLRDLGTTEPGDAGDAAAPEAGVEDGSDGGARPDSETPGEDGPTDEDTPLREGGVLEEAFGGEDPFTDLEFDCITEPELDQLEETLGPEARVEVEELITLGYLERC